LSFDPKFCLDSLNDFLENEFIDLSPPKFSSQKIAEKFLDDAFDLAIVDNEMLNEELEWLKSVALENNLEDKWFDKNLQNATNKLKPRKHYTSI